MRFEGTLTSWNDERGFGRLESTTGGEPIFVHISAWPRGPHRPQPGQSVTFEVESGPKGKRATNVQFAIARRPYRTAKRPTGAEWGTASIFVIPTFLAVYALVTVLWKVPAWVAGLYVGLSVITFAAYAIDKRAAGKGARRTPEGTLHMLALAGGWPGALLAQQLLRHKSIKQPFRQVYWASVVLNTCGLVVLNSPLRQSLLPGI